VYVHLLLLWNLQPCHAVGLPNRLCFIQGNLYSIMPKLFLLCVS